MGEDEEKGVMKTWNHPVTPFRLTGVGFQDSVAFTLLVAKFLK